MSYLNNTHLIVNHGVKMAPRPEAVIILLDQYFKEADHHAKVTRVLSTPEDQIDIIRNFLKIHGLDKKYPSAMSCHIADKAGDKYVWQMAWSNLLNIGIIINPPLAAECLMDYIRDGVNKKGRIINQTPHVRPFCFDIGGRGGDNPTIVDELAILNLAMKNKLPGLINVLAEHGNNCCHCDVK
jgi:hypothetical protein